MSLRDASAANIGARSNGELHQESRIRSRREALERRLIRT